MDRLRSESEAVVRRLYSAWSSGDVEGVARSFAEHCVFEDVTLETKAEGRDALRELVAAVGEALPDLTWAVDFLAIDGEICTCECRFAGTLVKDLPGIPAKNERVEIRELVLLTIRDEQIHAYRGYWSMGMLLRQLGYTVATH